MQCKKLWLAAVAAIVLGGCQTQPEMQKIQSKNKQLQSELSQAKSKIGRLEATQTQLRAQVDELNRVKSVLDTEKDVRVRSSTKLRGQVRHFVQERIDSMKDFLVRSDLLDYVGSELVQRAQVDKKPRLLVDMANPMPRDGTLTGVSAKFVKPGTFSVQVLRPTAGKLVVIWQSSPLKANQAGLQRINFPVSVGVEKGDLAAYYFDQPGLVSFDAGTGNTRYQDQKVSLGTAVNLRELGGKKEKRAYSIGVYGLLN